MPYLCSYNALSDLGVNLQPIIIFLILINSLVYYELFVIRNKKVCSFNIIAAF